MGNLEKLTGLFCDHWNFRLWAAEAIAAEMDATKFSVKAIYLVGSVKSGNPGPSSDIDLLIHFAGNEEQRYLLLAWLDGWSQCLDEINFLNTGNRTEGLLDIHLITDDEIRSRSSFAFMIDSPTDKARPLKLGKGDS